MARRKRARATAVASTTEQTRDDWVVAQPADQRRSDAITASVTTEQALLDAYPGSAESLATLAATLGIAWTLVDATTVDE
ncbi:MAG: hypothetical protein AB8B93_00075 [Pseudomonadales bacterium]